MPWLEDWLTHPDRDDPYWAGLQIPVGRPGAAVPVSLLTGWWDACLDPVLEDYRPAARRLATPVRLVIGPWTHASAFSKALPVVLGEALGWLRAHTADGKARSPQRRPPGAGVPRRRR